MQRIWITGSSGSGKTTLANQLGETLNIPVYHRDNISWGENWQERSEEEQIEIVKEIVKNDYWIFEGNRFTASREDGRLKHCDTIMYLNMNRFLCLYRVVRRYVKHRKYAREELCEGCQEEYTFDVAKYVLVGYPKKKAERNSFFKEAEQMGKKVISLNGRKEVEKWLSSIKKKVM